MQVIAPPAPEFPSIASGTSPVPVPRGGVYHNGDGERSLLPIEGVKDRSFTAFHTPTGVREITPANPPCSLSADRVLA